MTTKYISINSVLYDLSLTLPERLYNENQMSEWAHKALRLIRSDQMLESKLALLTIEDHKVELPSDLKYLIQVAYKVENSITNDTDLILPTDSSLADQLLQVTGTTFPWRAMRLTTNPYHGSICLDEQIIQCTDCSHTFSVSSNLVLTSTLQEGLILVAYMGYPVDEDGSALIPDDEELKEAILYYLLYRY